MRVLLVVAYDGTAYHGWQVQSSEPMTIEGQLNRVLTELTGEEIQVIGASRTDAGVHALGNIAVFDTNATIPSASYKKAMNGRLPWDIRIVDSYQVEDDFHPRHRDTKKTYVYRIYHGDVCMPMDRHQCFHVYGPVDVDKMKMATEFFIGEHDFAAFCATGSQAETTVRTIYELEVTTKPTKEFSFPSLVCADGEKLDSFINKAVEDEYIEIRVQGSGFLYNMVRIIAGTLLAVGRGTIAVEDIPNIIASLDRGKSGPTLPAMGLILDHYEFC